jgi:16S rRNA (uracil1498-N3)-methyltransferase
MHHAQPDSAPPPRFYCPLLPAPPAAGAQLPDACVPLDDAQAHHARKVLRLRDGAEVEVFSGRGRVGRGVLRSEAAAAGARDAAACVALTQVHEVERSRPEIDVAAAFPKGPRADDMVEQLSQAGVDHVIPLHTRRGVVLPGAGKLARYERALIESAKQCGRNFLMTVTEPATLDQVFTRGHDLRLLADPWAAGPDAPPPTPQVFRAARRVLILIGPEGGWMEDELHAAGHAGCTPWLLGPQVMRIETAAVAAAAIARYLAAAAV